MTTVVVFTKPTSRTGTIPWDFAMRHPGMFDGGRYYCDSSHRLAEMNRDWTELTYKNNNGTTTTVSASQLTNNTDEMFVHFRDGKNVYMDGAWLQLVRLVQHTKGPGLGWSDEDVDE